MSVEGPLCCAELQNCSMLTLVLQLSGGNFGSLGERENDIQGPCMKPCLMLLCQDLSHSTPP